MRTEQDLRWYALYTRSNCEARVAHQVGGEGVEHYLPVFSEWHAWTDRRKQLAIPLFPGYLFARFAEDSLAHRAVVRARGLIRILCGGDRLAPVPDGEVESVRRILENCRECNSHPLIREGSPVRIRHGALRGLEGLLVRIGARSRIVVSVPLLGRSVSAEIDLQDVVPLSRARA